MTTRRMLIKTGAASVVVIGAGLAAFAMTRAPTRARAPWSTAGDSFGDPRLDALAYAILAPNPHNMQPWRVRLDGENGLTVFCDLARLLPETDPPNRQITIGFGCFLELLRQAAAEKGFRVDVTPFPEGEAQPNLDRRPIASAIFERDDNILADPLFAAALNRRTNRAPYTNETVHRETLAKIIDASIGGVMASGATESELIDDLKSIAREAWRIEWNLDRTRRESIAVTRIGKSEVNDDPWGLALTGTLIDGLSLTGLLTRDKMDIPGATAFDESLGFYLKAIDTSSAFVWTSTNSNRRVDQLAAGVSWVRMQQAATLAGVAFHPLSQALQEFPEMAGPYARVHDLLALQPGATVQMLARIGYAPPPPPAPREPLASKIIRA